ncbi:MAG: histidine phosphatase family protein [Defluviitaleaceae bacterium]|nr:histidine phosphatase family protein [Defluviitaleaceae bacterium]
MKLHLIRHGKTLANEKRLYCGHTDLPLSDNGINELLEIKKQCIYPLQADLYFTSGLLRTAQTLDLLYGPVQSVAIPQLMEYSFGNFEMKSHDDLNGQAEYQNWIDDTAGHYACPGGESKQDFARRVSTGLGILLTSAQEASVLAVCHGGVITYIMQELFPGKHNFYEWQPAPGRGYTLISTPGELNQYKKI